MNQKLRTLFQQHRKEVLISSVSALIILTFGMGSVFLRERLAIQITETCPSPLVIDSPVDVSLATSILYPGQLRGGDYKAHGGFRFDKSLTNQINVKAPMSGSLVSGSRYIELGEVQYLLEFATPCGLKYRFDHLKTLTPKYAEIVSQFPEPEVGDSRTTSLVTPVTVSSGELIATEVGFSKNGLNVSLDFGVYDMRSKNNAAQDPVWASTHPSELSQHGVCWFDLLPDADETRVRSLPAADGVSGKNSDYCK